MSLYWWIVLAPLLTGCAAPLFRKNFRVLRVLPAAAGILHLGLVTAVLWRAPKNTPFLGVESLSDKGFLLLTSLLFLSVGIYLIGWLTAERQCGLKFRKPGLFIFCLPAFLATMSLVLLARNLGLLWVAVEATTLVSAPLILFHFSERSVEAMWKYLLICSVGIGFALLGTMFLAVSAAGAPAEAQSLNFDLLKHAGATLSPGWFKAAFLLILAGYGTKLGLAPFHTWLPDAHSEAPGAVSALLSAGLLNCSFVGIMRMVEIAPEPLSGFCKTMLAALGFFSLFVAGCFILRQTDFKRMLAYSSVEHMGLAAMMYALATPELTLLHLCGHTAIKSALFLTAGNLLLATGTRRIERVSGLFGQLPRNAGIWLAGLLFICAVPPSPLFFTELTLLLQMPPCWAIATALLLFAVFAGMLHAGLRMTMGRPSLPDANGNEARAAERLTGVPLTGLLAATALSLLFLLSIRGWL